VGNEGDQETTGMYWSDPRLDYEANLSEEELELQHKKKEWIYIQKSSIELATNWAM
jgi:hypothetical protein